MAAKKSWVWAHFIDESNDAAKCKLCLMTIQRKTGATSAMVNHLALKHRINKPIEDDSFDVLHPEVKKRKLGSFRSVLEFVKRESLGEILAKCSSKDGFAVSKIIASEIGRAHV